jgi:molybdenum cofactor synthesis domain-containing protein
MITAAVLTISDKGSRGEREDRSGPLIADMLKEIGAEILYHEIIPDEQKIIQEKLIGYSSRTDLILTTGGTGLAPRDVTPDATLAVIEKEVPGIAEIMRAEGYRKTKRSVLSRAVAGVKGGCLIINLPGSPNAVKENLEVILDVLPHAIEKIKGDTTECAPLSP